MTNREYFEQKKEAVYKKLDDWFTKHLKAIYLFYCALEVITFVVVLKVHIMFLALFIPWTIFWFGFTWAMIELWLDEEHKESE